MKHALFALLTLLIATAAAASPISKKYTSLGGPAGFLGAKTTEEAPTPDGVGAFQHFQNGSIYFHPEAGAHEVHGLIRDRYEALGWEQSFLGYPITDEIDLADGSGRVSKFKGGQLMWRPSTNLVTEVRSTDLVVDLPFTIGEAWRVGQTNSVDDAVDSHVGPWAYCWDLNLAQGASGGKAFVAAATNRIVLADEHHPSGGANPGNVVVQRFGEGRYGAYLHIAKSSYTKQFAKGPGIVFKPQGIGWDSRPVPDSGTPLGEVGDTGTGVGNHHMHFCVTTAPDRKAYEPYESVPVAFRNYSVSTNGGATWTFVSQGVPRSGQWVRREHPSTMPLAAVVNGAAHVIGRGTVKGLIKAGDGKPTGPGKLTITVMSAWGEPLRSTTVTVPATNLAGPWPYELKIVPAYNNERVVVTYKGPWNRPSDRVGAEGETFTLAPDGVKSQTLSLKTTLIH